MRAGALAALLILSSAILASEASAQVRIRLGRVKGPAWSRVRAAIQVALKAQDEVRLVRRGEMGRIRGEVEKGGRGYIAELTVVDANGRGLKSARFAGVDGRSLAGDIKERMWSRLGDAIVGLGPEPPPREPPVASPPPAPGARPSPRDRSELARSAEDERARSPAPTQISEARLADRDREGDERPLGAEALRFSVGAGIYARDLTWVDDLFDRLAGYSLGAAPAFRLGAEWYPGAHFSRGPASWFGLDVEAELPFAVESNRAGTVYPTAASAWRVGVVGRAPVEPVELRLGLGLAERRFAIEVSETGEPVPDLPEVRYQTLSARFGLTVRILDRVDLTGQAGWGVMLDAGEVGRSVWFPRSLSHTASAGGQVGVHIARGVGAFGRFDWQGAFFDLRPEPGDERVAGGASDNFYLGTVGLSFSTEGS